MTSTSQAPQVDSVLGIRTGLRPPQRARIIPILITATPRSGTVFLQTLLRKLGIYAVNDWTTPLPATKVMVSWIHVMKEERDMYFGPAKLAGSKFNYLWHQTRDPLKSLTSMAFTEPISQKTTQSRSMIRYLTRHIAIKNMDDLKQTIRNNPNNQLEWDQMENKTVVEQNVEDQCLIHRGMEFYIAWHSYVFQLHVPLFSLEDLTIHQNFTALNAVFKALGKEPPAAETVRHLLSNLRRRRRQRRLQRQLQHLARQGIPTNDGNNTASISEQPATKKTKQVNSRQHRSTLQWEELCQVNPLLTQEFLDVSHRMGYYQDTEHAC